MKDKIVIFFIFTILTTILTYPLVFKIDSCIPGFCGTEEPYAMVWGFWRIQYSFQYHLSLGYTSLIAYPFGIDIYSSGYLSYVLLFWQHFLSILTAPVVTFNIQILFNFLLSAIFTYLLVYYLTDNKVSAFFSGIIFAFCPYQFARTWQHLSLTYNGLIPLILYAAIILREKPCKKQAIFFITSALLLFSIDYAIMYFATIALATFLLYCLIYHWRTKLFKQRDILKKDIGYFKKVIGLLVIAFMVLLPQFFPIIRNRIMLSSVTVPSIFNPYRRSFDDLFTQSAEPLSYLLPATVHPLFGKFTKQFIGSPFYGVSFTESTLYLGWIPICLSITAYSIWKKRRKESKMHASEIKLKLNYQTEDFYMGFFIFLAIVAWVFSQSPWWKAGPIKIYMPSFFMYKILPMYRAYCRFGIVVMLAVAVLAGFGLKFILEKLKTQKTKIAVVTLFCALVLFEFWNYPPFRVIDLTKYPKVYDWLKTQPSDVVIAEYPLDLDGLNPQYLFYQTKHHRRMINATTPGTYANRISRKLTKLYDNKTAEGLSWLGVKYVLVHLDWYKNDEDKEEQREIEGIEKNKGLRFVRQFDEVDVYEVIASPVEPKVKEKNN